MIEFFIYILIFSFGIVVVALTLFTVVAVMFGIYRGMRDVIRGRKVQVQDNTLPPPTRRP